MDAWAATALDRLRSPILGALAGLDDVWVVGGAVRDALLGRQPRELDVVVEGDPAPVLARLGEPDIVHERFGTATLGGVDVVAARRETYARPGALPDVVLGATIDEDLARRDFTVNTLAVRLRDGRGAAWPGALDDLEAGRLRVLHDGSFVDDPTRLLRLVRYAARLGFEAEPHTAALAADAVGAGAVATVTGPRLGNELRLALREPLPAALEALARDGLGRAVVHPAFTPDRELLEAVLEEAPEDADAGLAALAACLLDAPPRELAAALDGLAFRASERDAVVAASRGWDLVTALASAGAPSAVASLLRRREPEALAVAAALGAREPVDRWLAEWRHVVLAISGEDLLAAGLRGPAVGDGLRRALDAALDGRAADRETQLRVALRG